MRIKIEGGTRPVLDNEVLLKDVQHLPKDMFYQDVFDDAMTTKDPGLRIALNNNHSIKETRDWWLELGDLLSTIPKAPSSCPKSLPNELEKYLREIAQSNTHLRCAVEE